MSADGLVAGSDILFGEGAANLPGEPGDFDDIIFGDHGIIVFSDDGIIEVDEIRTAEPDNGAADEIFGELGDDVLLGGAGPMRSPPASATTS